MIKNSWLFKKICPSLTKSSRIQNPVGADRGTDPLKSHDAVVLPSDWGWKFYELVRDLSPRKIFDQSDRICNLLWKKFPPAAETQNFVHLINRKKKIGKQIELTIKIKKLFICKNPTTEKMLWKKNLSRVYPLVIDQPSRKMCHLSKTLLIL